MIVKGRLLVPASSLTPNGKKEAKIRIDDEANPDFWLEIYISKEELERVLIEMKEEEEE